MINIPQSKKLEIIVPVTMESDDISAEVLASRLLELHRVYRFDTFGLAFPCKGWRSVTSCPPAAYFQAQAALFKEVKSSLASEGVRLGWWNTLTIKGSAVPEWQRIVGDDGASHGFASCPLDTGYRTWFVDSMVQFIREAGPDFILIEDDFGLHGGCFCQRHLEEFSRREGRLWVREELVQAMSGDSDDARALFLRWSRLKRDTLSDFARDIRRAVDAVSPELPIGTCQSGSWNLDGDATEAVTGAFAGGTQPFTRLYGAFYDGEDISAIPELLHHSLLYKQTLPPHFRCLHESDTYPHNSFFTSAACMRAMMSIVYSQGFAGSVLQGGYLHKDRAYAAMHAEEIDRFQALHDAASQCTLRGVRLPYVAMFRKGNSWMRSVAHFGIPWTTAEAPVTFLNGAVAQELSDIDVRALFSKGLFLDGDAAAVLAERGFGELMGVDVLPNPVSGAEKYDLYITERVEDVAFPEMQGNVLTSYGVYSPGGDGTFHGLRPRDGAVAVTRAYTWRQSALSVAMTRYVNRLGGRVVVMGLGTRCNRSLSLFSYPRQALLQALLCWCGGDVVFLKGAARVCVIMNEAKHPSATGFAGMVTCVSLNPDRQTALALHLPESWRGFKALMRLDDGGHWQEQTFERTADGVRISVSLDYARVQAFLFCV